VRLQRTPLLMIKPFHITTILFLITTSEIVAQSTDSLELKIQQIVSTKNAMMGVSIIGNNGRDTVSVNAENHYPMQSVFKFHIALAVLSQIEKGKFSLDQKIEIRKTELLPNLYSPLREKYPNGGTLTISEILKYTISASDNVGCEVLLRLLGGAELVEKYFVENNFKDISIKFNEEQQQSDWDLQFQNWTTPKAANKVLASFYYNKENLLSKKSYDFIWKAMKETETGQGRLKGQLPKGTIVAHKTGSSGANKDGLTAAVNDIGIVFLPNGKHYFISVFVTNSREDADTNEKIIADISKATWDYFTSKMK
jgi:beta-lactamase class A